MVKCKKCNVEVITRESRVINGKQKIIQFCPICGEKAEAEVEYSIEFPKK